MFSNYDRRKLEINYRKKFDKFTKGWGLNHTLLSNQPVKGEARREVRKQFGASEKEDITNQNSWGCR